MHKGVPVLLLLWCACFLCVFFCVSCTLMTAVRVFVFVFVFVAWCCCCCGLDAAAVAVSASSSSSSSEPVLARLVRDNSNCSFESHYPYQYVTYKTSEAPVIDGSLDEPLWQEVAWTRDFLDISGPDFPTPRFKTAAKIRWDDKHLYIGAYLQEPQIWATLTKHDSVIFHDNDFEVFVCPDGTSHYYKEFEMNALNTTWSLCLNKPYANNGYENSSRVFGKHGWDDPGLRSGVYVDGVLNDVNVVDKYWTVEIAFPLTALAYNTTANVPPTPGEYWRINFSRVEWHVFKNGSHYSKVPNTPEDNWVLAPTYKVAIHRPEYWAYLQFADTHVNGTSAVKDPDWTIRFLAMQLYYAELSFKMKSDRYSADLAEVEQYTPIPGALTRGCTGKISVSVDAEGKHYSAHVPDVSRRRVAVIRDDRYLIVHDT
ncbi:hypothetical protein PTSG_03794 [Salpingoeca rosetta]|uniref:Carbohydrate-binding domain-containing protein n=1 Tax=Salpingoeca rosetta (strain ATCC 50818 / BSB-021) TaxID=946362 RepID=F2U5E7_SALR5|nr:uncharacterized protein PTSG_03794 [Salpingoeca rosetta]EGD83163.1 hypothetical protein PTSG_03794 [Salpingoeca rosetta]|eukprot:XP_004995527.1 hypothetical protein PTSG_03794 [Salpingoeca rosetta]